MICLEDHEWADLRDNWTAGLLAVCAKMTARAQKALADHDAEDAVGIAKLQQEIKTYTKDLPSLPQGLNEFLARESANKRARP